MISNKLMFRNLVSLEYKFSILYAKFDITPDKTLFPGFCVLWWCYLGAAESELPLLNNSDYDDDDGMRDCFCSVIFMCGLVLDLRKYDCVFRMFFCIIYNASAIVMDVNNGFSVKKFFFS